MKNRALSWIVGVIAVFTAGAVRAEGEDTVTSKAYVDHEVGLKQPKLAAQSGDYAVLYPNSTGGNTSYDEDGEVQPRAIVSNLQGNDATALVTAGAVKTAMDSKQNTITGITAGDIMTYNGNGGGYTGTKVYNSSAAYTASGQSTALVTANQVNSAVTYGLEQFLSCAGWVDDDQTKDCILYQINIPQTVFVVP